jgi:signal recognition particle subunit SRP54
MREVRVALLEADVSLPVARQFIKAVEKKATGAAVTKSVTPASRSSRSSMTSFSTS